MPWYYLYIAFGGILGGAIMIASGLGMYWQGVLALLIGVGGLWRGIYHARTERVKAQTRREPEEFPPFAGRPLSPCVAVTEPPIPLSDLTGPYTAEDFPCPDPVPGRADFGSQTGPVPFAVIVPARVSAEQWQEIGRRLTAWQRDTPGVIEIVGLEQLNDGRPPETPSAFLFVPSPPYAEHVALVIVAAEIATAATARTLAQCLEGCPIVEIVDPDYYSFTNR